MRRLPLLCLGAGLLAVSGAAFAQDGSFGAKIRKAQSTKHERRTSTVTPLQFADLPRASLPPLLDNNKKPRALPSDAPELPDLKLIPNNPADYTRWKTGKADSWLYARLELQGGRGLLNFVQNMGYQNSSNTLSVSCTNAPNAAYYQQAQALRWERFILDANDNPSLEVNDGWFDPRTCKPHLEKRTSIQLKTVLQRDGKPLAFASRSEDEMTLYFPPETSIAADNGAAIAGSVPLVTRGALWRVTIPVRKGLATGALAEIRSNQIPTWLAQARGKVPEAPKAYEPYRAQQVGVDVIQTVSDAAPTILLRANL